MSSTHFGGERLGFGGMYAVGLSTGCEMLPMPGAQKFVEPDIHRFTLRPLPSHPRVTGKLTQSNPRSVDDEAVDPATWRLIELVAWKPNEETCDIKLIRPLWWIEETRAKAGSMIRLSMPEMGIVGPAKVLSVGPCPPLEPPTPNTEVITGTFKHKAKVVLLLHTTGLSKPLGVTPGHPMFSLDHNGYVSAGNLRVGELLKTRKGSTRVTRIEISRGERAVYNLEVHRTHTYYVSDVGILVHNACAAYLKGAFGANDVVDAVAFEIEAATTRAEATLQGGGTGGTRWGRIYQRYAGTGTFREQIAYGNAIQQVADGMLLDNTVMQSNTILFNRGSYLGLRNSAGNLLRPDYQLILPGESVAAFDTSTMAQAAKIRKYDGTGTSYLINISY